MRRRERKALHAEHYAEHQREEGVAPHRRLLGMPTIHIDELRDGPIEKVLEHLGDYHPELLEKLMPGAGEMYPVSPIRQLGGHVLQCPTCSARNKWLEANPGQEGGPDMCEEGRRLQEWVRSTGGPFAGPQASS